MVPQPTDSIQRLSDEWESIPQPSTTHQHSLGLPYSPTVIPHCNGSPYQSVVPSYNGAISSNAILPFRPIAERSPRLDAPNQDDDQPLDLTVKFKREDDGHLREHDNVTPSSPPSNHCDSEALNLSQRSSRTPPKYQVRILSIVAEVHLMIRFRKKQQQQQ
ncbi:zinc finger E-box-binding homeobox protein zag-1 [Caerostris extrusa]|uniref:Zinc finger E-box-binding homeobox protein zag-1 n=1 Tax=Caerostris extrusa TaxID=172846 RepID=A0AAV4U9B8_CAEEX|nr:zinc finger E-box-binding homeobox protein zag-1 [Caerostris extrusa]